MKDGPDIARIAALIGDPARANMLAALMSGKALTARELATEAGITPQTASSHLRQLEEAVLLTARAQGRHRYYALADGDVAEVLENLMGLAAKRGQLRVRTGPKDAALRLARVCYNHLAGTMGVHMMHSLVARNHVVSAGDSLELTDTGHRFFRDLGIATDDIKTGRGPLCRPCLDWSARQSHLAGPLGRAVLTFMIDDGWVSRQAEGRALNFGRRGLERFETAFGPLSAPN